MKSKPRVSVIIPVAPGGNFRRAIQSVQKLDYPENKIEVILALGYSPSKQRNKAARNASGSILYFIDNDSAVQPKALRLIVEGFTGRCNLKVASDSRGFSVFPGWLSRAIVRQVFSGTVSRREIVVVGGPNIWLQTQTFSSSIAGAILESFFLHGKMAARYRSIGIYRRASEKELILCNLAIKKSIFKVVKGFNESLYPNEENELLNRLEKLGYQLIYHPNLYVCRPRRETLLAHAGAVFHYGRGRMEQIRVEGVGPSLLFLMPLFLMAYLVMLVFYHPLPAFLPFAGYFFMALGSALGYASRKRKLYLTLVLPPLFLLTHLTYAVGLLEGLITNLKKKRLRVGGDGIEIRKLKMFNQTWTTARRSEWDIS